MQKKSVFAEGLGLSFSTFYKISKHDPLFPETIRKGRDAFMDADSFHRWLKSRTQNPESLLETDKVITRKRVLEMLGRSDVWFWMQLKCKSLTRFNLAPVYNPDRFSGHFIEREIREQFPDLVSQGE